MRARWIVLLFAVAALLLSACADQVTPPEAEQLPVEQPAEEPAEIPEQLPEKVPPEFSPYLQKIVYGAQDVFDGPGYDHCYVTTAGAGTYTIVEESLDPEGNLWGRLKSGLGWVDLSQVRKRNESPGPLIIGFVDEALRQSAYHACVVDASEYAQPLAFRATEVLREVQLSSLQYSERGLAVAAVLYTLEELATEKPLVADVVFYGDMTTYGVSFVDSSGEAHNYALSISGRNGSLVVQEYTAS